MRSHRRSVSPLCRSDITTVGHFLRHDWLRRLNHATDGLRPRHLNLTSGNDVVKCVPQVVPSSHAAFSEVDVPVIEPPGIEDFVVDSDNNRLWRVCRNELFAKLVLPIPDDRKLNGVLLMMSIHFVRRRNGSGDDSDELDSFGGEPFTQPVQHRQRPVADRAIR